MKAVTARKPRGRLARNYRLTWVDDSGCTAAAINPPVSPARLAHLMVGGLAGTPVDAFVATVGPSAGYTLSYPTRVDGMEFLVDRLNAGAVLGGGGQWRGGENLRRLWADGHDPVRIVMDEAHRLGIDFWLQLRMNDWHHVDRRGKVYRLIGSDWYESHPELLIGTDGAAGWPESLQASMAWFQDFAHERVRRIRFETAREAIERYDADGWEYDFMRCPGLFRYGEERRNAHLITELIRDTRRMLDEVGRARGKTLGLSVRVPNTVAGAAMLGLDVEEWVADHLIDIVVPSTFFAQDTEEDMREWVKLAAGTPVLVHPAIEEGFLTGMRTGYGIPYFQVKSDPMQAMTVEMIRALAARHHAAGVDGLYLFNFPGTWGTYRYDNSPALDDIASPLRLRFKDKRYAVMRRNGSFPNCFPQERRIPAELGPEPTEVRIEVADDLAAAGARVRAVRLKLLLVEPCHEDRLEVRLNGGEPLPVANPMAAGRAAPGERAWAVFDLTPSPPRRGVNRISVRAERHPRLAAELPLVLSDVEIDVSYRYPNGPWRRPPGFDPRT